MKQDRMNTPVYRLIGRSTPKKGDIGIEIEAETRLHQNTPSVYWQSNSDKHGGTNSSYWSLKPDHSLRNGMEFVTKRPVPVLKLRDSLENFEKYAEGTPWRDDSIRTSVHFHINVTGLTVNQILCAVAGYWLLETILVDTQGPARRGNLFCLRVQDAEYILESLSEALKEPKPMLGYTLGDNVKYGALNLAAVAKYGSLEFRFIKGTTNIDLIQQWAEFFYNMVHKFASFSNVTNLMEHFVNLGPVPFATKYLPMSFLSNETPFSTEQKIETNLSYVYTLMSAAESESKRSSRYVFRGGDDEDESGPFAQVPLHPIWIDQETPEGIPEPDEEDLEIDIPEIDEIDNDL